MPKAGDSFIVTLKPSHLGWGIYRYTDTRDPIYGEGYIQIPRQYAEKFGIFNYNHPAENSRYHFTAVNGQYSGTLLAQGCSRAGDVYAKQFAEEKNLKGIVVGIEVLVRRKGEGLESHLCLLTALR